MNYICVYGPSVARISKGILHGLPLLGPGVFSSSNFQAFLPKYTFTTGMQEQNGMNRFWELKLRAPFLEGSVLACWWELGAFLGPNGDPKTVGKIEPNRATKVNHY